MTFKYREGLLRNKPPKKQRISTKKIRRIKNYRYICTVTPYAN